ncbi:MYB-related protein [Gracilaria domingensis]|nr:MYB-related protein [Gracilaria domingensis]
MNRRRYLSPISTSPCSSPSRSHRISVQALTDACALPKLLHFPHESRSLYASSSSTLPNLSRQLPHPPQQLPAFSFRQRASHDCVTSLVPPNPQPLHAVPSTLLPPPPPPPHSLPSAHHLTSQYALPPNSNCYPLHAGSDERSVQSAPSLHDTQWRSPSYPSIHLHDAPYAIAKRPRKRGTVKRLWTPQEDDRLRCLARLRPENWNVIAESLPGRTGKQCRERWLNHLQDGMCTSFAAFSLNRTLTNGEIAEQEFERDSGLRGRMR